MVTAALVTMVVLACAALAVLCGGSGLSDSEPFARVPTRR
jgi:hypothetical protein